VVYRIVQNLSDVIGKMLRRQGDNVAPRYSSSGAIEAFGVRPESFDLVITHLTMIHMSGVDLEREIFVSRRDTQIILCRLFSEALDKNRTKLLGFKGFLGKPVTWHAPALAVSKIQGRA